MFLRRIAPVLLIVLVAILVWMRMQQMPAQMAGSVSLDGKPSAIASNQRGTVILRPVSGGATAAGIIDNKGNYQVYTGSQSGLQTGQYLVGVSLVEILPINEPSDLPTAKSIIPAIYGNPLESGLLTNVSRGRNTFDIELKSDAGPVLTPQFEKQATRLVETNASNENALPAEGMQDNE